MVLTNARYLSQCSSALLSISTFFTLLLFHQLFYVKDCSTKGDNVITVIYEILICIYIKLCKFKSNYNYKKSELQPKSYLSMIVCIYFDFLKAVTI